MKKYMKFGLMILTSTIVMYFLMFVNVSEFAHFHLSQTRIYMALLMGGVMAIIMMLFMWKMYDNKKMNALILGISVLIIGVSFGFIQNQVGVGDTAWMKAMIPHHSTAILTSENANLKDPRVKELSEEIIQAQKEEIAEMERLIEELKENKEDAEEAE
ncbi:protein of unknown function [Atopostipes suicloacalis DSM 15692]|uniref:DUF305 domain-containing protein n=1 Tax=Atopostipes suicloacalis DSM 15692 TaxID=1121025 RepID=A0A1M4UE06_9LACT|nr:DUF305 domain-containing protein [Atopostipes suicloacalis]SHE54904.1 protein of unknown function [Atopostipes suicloacalis DSM 15692]